MVLNRAFFILSFVPLLMAQQPDCASLIPTFNDTIIDQLSGKWYYIASAFGFRPYQEEAQRIQSSFYYFIPNKTEDVFQGKEYNTIGDKCVYEESEILFNRTNGILSKIDPNQRHDVQVMLTQDQNGFFMFVFLNDTVLRGVSLSVSTQKASEEHLKEFQEIVKCLGFREEELNYTDWSKDKCEPLEKEHIEKQSKEAKDASRTEEPS
ncbi:alpha-1-acid glycoprotein 1 isoform X1 [Dromiciops gliroides]|uniref:alpha-1-acid glycoprotein 1 isoform X1 n=1 Tax=Dromiciops gliroides TaxID=33562 RepID=UPI001CC5F105|nr:alpha-1-acid glycoprotein 1 isoform X1 [Dromiciops gliroides]